MLTTLFFIQLIAFQLWHITSTQVKHSQPAAYLRNILDNKQRYRIVGGVLFLLSTVLFIVKLGWGSGIFASVVGLMGVGCLVVSLHPFRYFNEKTLALLYAFFFILELFV